MPYYPRPLAAIRNLPKPERHRVALVAWRRVIWHPVFLGLVGLNCLAFLLLVAQVSPPLVRSVATHWSLPVWLLTYGEYIDWPSSVAMIGYLFLFPSQYRRAVRDILREENVRPAACLMCGWAVGDLECYSWPGCGDQMLMPEAAPSAEKS